MTITYRIDKDTIDFLEQRNFYKMGYSPFDAGKNIYFLDGEIIVSFPGDKSQDSFTAHINSKGIDGHKFINEKELGKALINKIKEYSEREYKKYQKRVEEEKRKEKEKDEKQSALEMELITRLNSKSAPKKEKPSFKGRVYIRNGDEEIEKKFDSAEDYSKFWAERMAQKTWVDELFER